MPTLLTTWRQSIRRAFTPFSGREACLYIPAILLLVGTGLATGHATQGVIAAGAALSVGFGASRKFRGHRLAAMIAAALGMVVAGFIGTLAGQSLWVLAIVASSAAAVCAGLALIDEDLWWIVLQTVIALLVASYFPGTVAIALDRALTILIGGGAQIAIVATLAWTIPSAAGQWPPAQRPPTPSRRLLITHMLRAAICVALAIFAANTLGLANSYWAPMTALLVLKPGLHETHLRGVNRLLGTLLGCGAATVFAMLTDDLPYLLLLGAGCTAGVAFAVQKASYTTLSFAITATVVLLVSLGGGSVFVNGEHRLIATMLGGIIALSIARIAPHRPAHHADGIDRVGSSPA